MQAQLEKLKAVPVAAAIAKKLGLGGFAQAYSAHLANSARKARG